MKTKEEKKAYNAAWRAANPEKIRASRAAYRVANEEKIKATQAAYRATNKDQRNADRAAYRVANLDKERARNKVYDVVHKAERKVINAKYRAANPERIKAIYRQSRYGLTDGAFKQMLDEQANTCAICDFVFSTEGGKVSAAHVDHCHISGDIRGLLCSNCNKAIGLLKDSPVLLERAAEYLQSKLRDL